MKSIEKLDKATLDEVHFKKGVKIIKHG